MFRLLLGRWPFSFGGTFDSLQCTFISFLLAIVTICCPPGSLLRRASLFLQITFVFQAYLSPPPSRITDTATLYMHGVLLGNLTACYFDRLYSGVPEKKFYRIGEKGRWERGNCKGNGFGNLMQKFWWALELLIVRRGVGWNWQISNIPASKKGESRAAFLRLRLAKWVLMYCGLYLTAWTAKNILDDFQSIADAKLQAAVVSVVRNDIFLFVFIYLGSAMIIYSYFGIPMLSLSILCVGLRVGPSAWQEPEAWPPNFGSISEAYSVRRFWSITWHQQLRRIIDAPGAYILSLTPPSFLQSRTLAPRLIKRYFRLLSAFFISGTMHAIGNYKVTSSARARGLPLSLSDGNEILYFLAQAAAIILEDFALWLFGINDDASSPPTRTRKAVGFAVSAFWLIWSRTALKIAPAAAARGLLRDRGADADADAGGRNAQWDAAVRLVLTEAVAGPGNFVGVFF